MSSKRHTYSPKRTNPLEANKKDAIQLEQNGLKKREVSTAEKNTEPTQNNTILYIAVKFFT